MMLRPLFRKNNQPLFRLLLSNNAQSIEKEVEELRNDYRKMVEFNGGKIMDESFDQITDIGYLEDRVKDVRDGLATKYEDLLNDAVELGLLNEEQIDEEINNMDKLSLDAFMSKIKNLEKQVDKY